MSEEIRMKWTVHDVFGFLKPSWGKIGLTVFVFMICFVWWSMTAPTIGGNYCAPFVELEGFPNDEGYKLCGNLVILFFVAILTITYTLISIIVFFKSGEWKK